MSGVGGGGVDVAALIARHRFRFVDERELQDGIALVLSRAGLPFRREASLGPKRGTIDFLLDAPALGIEVKIKGTLAEVTRQLHRYAGDPSIDELLLVTSVARLARLPDTMEGKPVRVAHLLASAL
jgi:hypothetical protein